MTDSKQPNIKSTNFSTQWVDHKGEEHLLVHTPEGTVGFRYDDIAKLAVFFNKAAQYIKDQKANFQ